jgi:RND family efflux transporter MFP subunit
MTRAMVREARVMLDCTELRAPFEGVVARKLADAGDLAAPGAPLLEVDGADDFQIEAGIPDSLAAGLAVGMPLTVELPDTDASFSGRIAELSPAADSAAGTVLAKIACPAGVAVHSGQFARVMAPGATARALFAPASAVGTLGQMERVFVAQNHRAVLRLVKTGAQRGDLIEILSGVAAGESVVADPPAGLREGQALDAQP